MNPLHHLGQTRSTRQPTHLLHTPDSFVRIPLPGLINGEAIIHAAPALGAGFLQYTAELQPKGKLTPSSHQRFLYVLEGEASIIGPGLDQSVTLETRIADPQWSLRQHGQGKADGENGCNQQKI